MPPRRILTTLLSGVAIAAVADAARAGPAAASPEFSYFGGGGAAPSSQRQVLLVVPILNGRELSTSLAFWREPDGTDRVALTEFMHMCAIDATREADGSYRLSTPLGTTRLPEEAIQDEHGLAYVDVAALSKLLAARIAFDEAEFALRVELPWKPGATDTRDSGLIDRSPPDIRAPRSSLSRWRSEVVATQSDGEVFASANHRVAGALGPGSWRAEFDHALTGDDRDFNVEALSWMVDRGKSRWVVGQERLSLHPLLNSFELSGVQYAYSNRPDLVYAQQTSYDGQLVPYQARPTSVIRGSGPPGGSAELRYGGQVLARQTIRLDGRYEFRDVPAAPGDSVPIEVAVYAFGETGTPLRVDEMYSQAGNLQLPKGVNVHYAGIGANGFLLDSKRDGEGNAGFYQLRQGLTDRVTAEAIVQSVDGHQRVVAGTALNLGLLGSWAAYAGHSDNGAGARQILGDGQRGAWFWRANWLNYDADYQNAGAAETRSVRAEVGRSFGATVRASMIHVETRGQFNRDIRFTKPSAQWRPTPKLQLSARPEFDGRYAYDAQWYVRRGTRLSATRYGDVSQVAVDQDIGRSSRLAVSAQSNRSLGDRYTAIFNHYHGGASRFAWAAGVLRSDSTTGYLAEASLELRPGLSARLQAIRDPLRASDGNVIGLSIVADFAVTGAGLARGGASLGQSSEGGVSGVVAPPSAFPGGLSLGNIPILVDGHVRTRTQDDGHFHVADIAPGVHRVELDNEGLPIELAVANPPRRVEVRGGSLTRIDFALELRLGLAGRILDAAGNALANAQIELLDADGTRRGTARSSAFGYFRIDGITPGRYQLRYVDSAGSALAQHEVVLDDRFLFGQELKLAEPRPESAP